MISPPLAIENLWRVADVAAYLGCSTKLVYRKAEEGLLPCLRVGALLRFEPEAVRRWVRGEHSSPARVLPIGLRSGK